MLIEFLDPKSITIPSDRQRSKLDTGDLLSSIRRFGILNPIIIKRSGDQPFLVAGGRRLTCAIELGLDTIPCRDYSSLSPFELRCIELEENIKRKDLPWRDAVKAIGEIHRDQISAKSSWTQADTGEALSLEQTTISVILTVYNKLDDPRLALCTSYRDAYNVLVRQAERRTAGIVNEIMAEAGGENGEYLPEGYKHITVVFNTDELAPNKPFEEHGKTVAEYVEYLDYVPEPGPDTPTLVQIAKSTHPILNQDFLTWDFMHVGPKFGDKFNLIHVDFPYGTSLSHDISTNVDLEYKSTPEVFWALTDHLLSNVDKFCSFSAHMVFWFSMRNYEELRRKLLRAEWLVHEFPFIWHDTSGKGIAPIPGQSPRQVYQTAFVCSRGGRPLVTTLANLYACPRPSTPIHPSQKPEPMLKHLFQMLVDQNTDMFDPTAGSGTALVAAEELGARSVCGLELSPEFCTTANDEIQKRRSLRKMRG
jgi:DNA methylase/ParB-like nuclease domain